jgi:hypothetical protein
LQSNLDPFEEAPKEESFDALKRVFLVNSLLTKVRKEKGKEDNLKE